jgi:hypothetical protein
MLVSADTVRPSAQVDHSGRIRQAHSGSELPIDPHLESLSKVSYQSNFGKTRAQQRN